MVNINYIKLIHRGIFRSTEYPEKKKLRRWLANAWYQAHPSSGLRNRLIDADPKVINLMNYLRCSSATYIPTCDVVLVVKEEETIRAVSRQRNTPGQVKCLQILLSIFVEIDILQPRLIADLLTI